MMAAVVAYHSSAGLGPLGRFDRDDAGCDRRPLLLKRLHLLMRPSPTEGSAPAPAAPAPVAPPSPAEELLNEWSADEELFVPVVLQRLKIIFVKAWRRVSQVN